MLRLTKIAALVSAILLLNAVTTLLFVQARVPATALVSEPCVDGDVNGDALVDIADPLYLLNHLFGGGPEPIACAQSTSGGAFLWARVGSISAAGSPGDQRFAVYGHHAASAESGLTSVVLPRGGTIHSLVVTRASLPTFNGDFTVTLHVDGVATALSASTASTPPTNSTDSVTVAAGAEITFVFESLGAQAAGSAMVVFD